MDASWLCFVTLECHSTIQMIINIKYVSIIHTHTTHASSRRGSRGISDIFTFSQNYLAKRNTADMTGGKPIAV
jgi:hypothetical protein